MNKLGHNFFKIVNNCSFKEIDSFDVSKMNGDYYCNICNIQVYYYSSLDKFVYINKKYPTEINISCDEQIIKNLLE